LTVGRLGLIQSLAIRAIRGDDRRPRSPTIISPCGWPAKVHWLGSYGGFGSKSMTRVGQLTV
jgi:hypothetical protein